MLSRKERTRWASVLTLLALLGGMALPGSAAIPGTGGGTGSPPAAGETHGTLVSSDGKHVYDWQLDALINRYIGNNYQSKILAFTECYGGDKIDDFAGDRNTTIISGSQSGKVTYYGGYHSGASAALKPGATTNGVHQAGVAHKASGDTPVSNGPNQDIGVGGAGGAITSCHVLVWAGRPNNLDQADINNIKNNFAGQPNTTVTVLSGNGTGADGAATFRDLRRALAQIGAMMNPNEQFILFVTDHGNIDRSRRNVIATSGGANTFTLAFDPAVYNTMVADPGNDPYLALFTDFGASPIAPGTLTVSFNGEGPYTVGYNIEQLPLDYDGDGAADQYEYHIPLVESTILPGDNTVTLVNNGTTDVSLLYVSLDSGAIQRPGDPSGGAVVP